MNWGGIVTVFLLGTIKFMVAPVSGPPFELSFLETYIAACAGAMVGTATFYFAAEFFIKRAERKRKALKAEMLEKGEPYEGKKKFTRMNRFIVKLKSKLGIIGISFWAPFFLSIPIGAIVVAKFYGKEKKTYPLMCLGTLINGLATTSIVYLFFQ